MIKYHSPVAFIKDSISQKDFEEVLAVTTKIDQDLSKRINKLTEKISKLSKRVNKRYTKLEEMELRQTLRDLCFNRGFEADRGFIARGNLQLML
jgi:phosphoenolpyruvate carboxylase